MNPFYFGSSQRPLFGVFSHAKGTDRAPWSVLLCYPAGSEYMRAHRAFRQMNTLLNRAGASVLRFDYSCTGDSAGDSAEATVESWLEDIDWAMDELKDNADTETFSVAGLRMGATLAALACRSRDDVKHLLLWDPIVSGSTYLDAAVGSPRPSGVVGVEGFPMTRHLCEGIDGIDLRRVEQGDARVPTSIYLSDESQSAREVANLRREAGADIHLEVVPSLGNWGKADPFGDALIPQAIIQAIVDRLKVAGSQ